MIKTTSRKENYALKAFGFLLAVVVLASCAQEKAPEKRPNIILILADDMGYSDLGSYGSEINTPSLDKLAAGGLRMTQFYNASRCCPTRASLLTGLYPHQANMGFMQEDCGLPAYGGHIPDNAATIAQVLQSKWLSNSYVGQMACR